MVDVLTHLSCVTQELYAYTPACLLRTLTFCQLKNPLPTLDLLMYYQGPYHPQPDQHHPCHYDFVYGINTSTLLHMIVELVNYDPGPQLYPCLPRDQGVLHPSY